MSNNPQTTFKGLNFDMRAVGILAVFASPYQISMKGVYLFSNPTNYYNDIASAHICALMTRMCDRVLTIKPNLYTGMGYTGELGTIST